LAAGRLYVFEKEQISRTVVAGRERSEVTFSLRRGGEKGFKIDQLRGEAFLAAKQKACLFDRARRIQSSLKRATHGRGTEKMQNHSMVKVEAWEGPNILL